jgi:hypothetical protein
MDFNAIMSAALGAAITQALQPLEQRINELEQQLNIERGVGIALAGRIDNLLFVGPATTPALVVNGTDGEPVPSPWLRNEIMAIVDGALEASMEQHTSDYDHDDFQTADQVEDFVRDQFSEGLSSKISDLLESASISISL